MYKMLWRYFSSAKSARIFLRISEPEGKQQTKLQLSRRDKILVEPDIEEARAVRYGMVYSMRPPESWFCVFMGYRYATPPESSKNDSTDV